MAGLGRFLENAPDYGMVLVLLGVILAASIFADLLAKKLRLPRISFLVLLGVALALARPVFPDGGTLAMLDRLAEPLITIALVMIAFLLGGDLTIRRLKATGLQVMVVSLAVVLFSVIVVGGGLVLLGLPLAIALPLAAISAATDPAAVREVVRESGHRNGFRQRLLLGIVAIDDAWGIIAFGLIMAVYSGVVLGNGQPALILAVWELVGGVLLGALIGVPAAILSGRLQPGEPTQAEALAVVLSIAGLATLLEVSPLLAAMTAGLVTANLSSHHNRSFREIENIEWPFLVFFFVLSGATIDLSVALGAAMPVIAYMLLRLAGRLVGGVIGGWALKPWRKAPSPMIGLALTPQAGVAMGMALLAAEYYPETGPTLIAVAACSTIVFEVIGPVFTRLVLTR